MEWIQVGAFFVTVLGLGLAGMVYLTRQFNRLSDRIGALEQRLGRVEERLGRVEERLDRVEERLDHLQVEVRNIAEGLQNVEKEQARMLGFLEGRGIMGRAPADVETIS